jgi:hypothetical protein
MSELLGRVRFALLAQHVVDHGGMVSILNGGWTRLDVLEFPGQAAVNVVGQAQDVPGGGVVGISVIAPDGQAIGQVSVLVHEREVGAPPPHTTTINVSLPLWVEQSGRYVIRLDGAVHPYELDFYVASLR